MGGFGRILALEGRAAAEEKVEEEEEEEEQNAPPLLAELSVCAVLPLPGSRGTTIDTCDVGIWERSRGWPWGAEWDSGARGCVC